MKDSPQEDQNEKVELDNTPLLKQLSFQNKYVVWLKHNKSIVSLVLLAIVLVFSGATYIFGSKGGGKTSSQTTEAPSITEAPTDTPVPDSQTSNQIQQSSPTQVPTVTLTPTPSLSPTPTVTPTPTSSPHTSNPPQMNITYPTNGQSISMNSSQTFCVVDAPGGGDTSGLMRKQNINNAGWNDYQAFSTLCYSPPNGANTLQLQYKNQYGDESSVYSINFTFERTN